MRMLGVVWVLGLALFGHMCGCLGANIALNGKVSQSSRYGDAGPQWAVDGNRASNFMDNSCTHTQEDRDPWWMLDLEKVYSISTVTITNRRDCCSERLNGAEIRIGDSPDAKANPRCVQISSLCAGATQSFGCNGMKGRYVSVVIPGRSENLTLCEVEVDGSPADEAKPVPGNIALKGNVSQSSPYGDAGPQRAVDGNRASNFMDNSCTHTQDDRDPWWRLDLEKAYSISTVTITNRRDCCSERLNGAEIRIGDSSDAKANPRCVQISSLGAGVTQSFGCNGMKGRYVSVVIPGRREHLTLCEVEVDGSPADEAKPVPGNIALKGNVSQSSPYGDAGPQRAVDGNRASNFMDNSCTHTQDDRDPWWRLDLEKAYSISTVTITNRRDCCSERLNGAEIRIGDSSDAKANPRCVQISSLGAGVTQSFWCNGMKGRYVSVVIPGRREHLTLCEVEVDGSPADGAKPVPGNIALKGNVSQSSPYGDAGPQRAVDGNRASNFMDNSCTHTQDDRDPWWRLDLEKAYSISTVTITNRHDCCSERLNGAEIRIGDSSDAKANPRCVQISSLGAGVTQSFECNGMKGRYVSVVIPGRREHLTLCEVEVYGSPADEAKPVPENIALKGNVSQSSPYGDAGPQRAVDGNRASNFMDNSCTHTQDDRDPWWRLDLEKAYSISTVTITNRRDCCSERLNGAEIRIGNSLDGNGNSNPRCAVISSIPAGKSESFFCNGMEGRYVNVVIPGRNEHLTLCEVEVFGTLADDNDEAQCGGLM